MGIIRKIGMGEGRADARKSGEVAGSRRKFRFFNPSPPRTPECLVVICQPGPEKCWAGVQKISNVRRSTSHQSNSCTLEMPRVQTNRGHGAAHKNFVRGFFASLNDRRSSR